jgi:hypothetical protein
VRDERYILSFDMTTKLRRISILVALLAVAVTPAQALAGKQHVAAPADLTATRAYVAADYALVHTARVNLKTGEAALESLRATLSAECPQAAAASPENEAAEHLSNEVVGAMGTVFIRSDTQAVASFAEAVSQLQWSNAQLTRKVDVYAAKLKAIAALATPDVCGDVRTWAASGYRTLPTTTTQFDRAYSANDVGIGEVPARLLAPYENARERGQLALTKQSENELVDAEARAVKPWSKILDALDLQP